MFFLCFFFNIQHFEIFVLNSDVSQMRSTLLYCFLFFNPYIHSLYLEFLSQSCNLFLIFVFFFFDETTVV